MPEPPITPKTAFAMDRRVASLEHQPCPLHDALSNADVANDASTTGEELARRFTFGHGSRDTRSRTTASRLRLVCAAQTLWRAATPNCRQRFRGRRSDASAAIRAGLTCR